MAIPGWLKSFAAKFEEGRTWVDRFLFWEGVLASFFGLSLVSYFGIREDFPIFTFGAVWFCGIAAYFVAFGLTHNRVHRRIITGLVLVGILAVIGYALRVQHNREEAARIAAERAADNYILQFDQPTMAPDIVAGKRGPHGSPLMSDITVGWVFNNTNDFDVWVKVFRRHVKIADRASDSEDQTLYTRVPRGATRFVVSDLQIDFPTPVELTSDTSGFMDFELCYGKQRNNMHKGFWQKIKLVFVPDDNGMFGRPPMMIPVNAEEGPYGYLDTCRG